MIGQSDVEKIITMDMFSLYYDLLDNFFQNAKIVLDRRIVQHLSRASRPCPTMRTAHRKSYEYKQAISAT